MNTIYTFFKCKLKEKELKVEDFIKLTNVSKSTIYRVMKGLQLPSDDLFQKISTILELSSEEGKKLNYYFASTNVDESTLAARSEVETILTQTYTNHAEKIELVYYDQEKYIRTLDEVLNSILRTSKHPHFTCRLRMLNCCHDGIINSIFSFLSELMENHPNFSIEHLLTFSVDETQKNVSVLKKIFPLLPFDNYTVLYSETEIGIPIGFFYDFMIIEYHYPDISGAICNKHLYISFLPDNFSSCFVTEDKNTHDFFNRNFDSLYLSYKFALNNQNNFDYLYDLIASLESQYDNYLFKPNPCYNRIPIDVYQSILLRSSPETIQTFLKSFLKELPADDLVQKQKLDELFQYLSFRVETSLHNRQIDIFTKEGLEAFASSGLLSDHIDDLPPLIGSEIRMVLEHIKSRDLDPDAPYHFYLLDKAHSNSDILISVFKDYGLLIEYNNIKYKTIDLPFCIIEHAGLSQTFCDFADNYLPTMIAIPSEEAHDFINFLIQKYC